MQHEIRLRGARRGLGSYDAVAALTHDAPWDVPGGDIALQGYGPAPEFVGPPDAPPTPEPPKTFSFPARRALPVLRCVEHHGHKERAKALALWQLQCAGSLSFWQKLRTLRFL